MSIDDLVRAVLEGAGSEAAQLTREALREGLEPVRILDEALTAAMQTVGEEYEVGDRFLPEMLVSADAMKAALRELRPKLIETGVKPKAQVVLGTVEGDLHDIGKDLVAMMLEGAGFEVIDLGTDVSAAQFVAAVVAHRPALLGMSALLTTTMMRMPEVIEALKETGHRADLRLMIGGAPVTEVFAATIEADGYAPDAVAAVRLAESLVAGEEAL